MADLSTKIVNDQIPPSQAARELLLTAQVKELANKQKEHSDLIQTNFVKGIFKGLIAVAAIGLAVASPIITGSLAVGAAFSALFVGTAGLYGYEAVRHFTLRSQRQAALAGIQATNNDIAHSLVMDQGVKVLSNTIEREENARNDGKKWTHAVSSTEQQFSEVAR
ncbi:MAG: hypothetical protein U1E36_04965 [Rickettsiales bacterium]